MEMNINERYGFVGIGSMGGNVEFKGLSDYGC